VTKKKSLLLLSLPSNLMAELHRFMQQCNVHTNSGLLEHLSITGSLTIFDKFFHEVSFADEHSETNDEK
jgi:hypothetical protein